VIIPFPAKPHSDVKSETAAVARCGEIRKKERRKEGKNPTTREREMRERCSRTTNERPERASEAEQGGRGENERKRNGGLATLDSRAKCRASLRLASLIVRGLYFKPQLTSLSSASEFLTQEGRRAGALFP